MSNQFGAKAARAFLKFGVALLVPALLCLALFVPPKVAAAPELPVDLKLRMKQPKSIANADDLARWMTYYYVHPQPELVVPAVLFADKNDLLTGDYVAPFQAFLSGVFAQNPDKVAVWFNAIAPMKESNRTLLLTSVWWSNTSQGKQMLQQLCKTLPAKPQAEFRKQIDSDPPQIVQMPIEGTAVLDMLWGCYCATGDEKYVRRLMTCLPWAEVDQKNLSKMMLASAAKWSLTSNCEQHPQVLEICRKVAASDVCLKKFLEPVIAEVTNRRRTASTGSGQ